MFRALVWSYFVIAIGMIATSLYTGHRASVFSGKQHYMFTRTTVPVEEYVQPDNPSDAAFEAATDAAGEARTLASVDKPCFVLGIADATGPVVIAGGVAVGLVAAWRRWRRHPRAVGSTNPSQVS